MLDARKLAEQRVVDRNRARTDKYFLANEVLGFNFQPCHAELFGCFVQFNNGKLWVEQDENKDRMVLWSRGHYKTTAIVVEAIQAILNFPDIRILLMQGSMTVTKTLMKQIMAHFTCEAAESKLSDLFPEFCGSRKKCEVDALSFTTPARVTKQLAQATVTVASPKSVKTGQHYDVGFFDDLVNDQNYRNPRLLDKVQEDFTLAQALIDPGGYRYVTGTRYAFGDLYEQIIRWQAASGKWIISIRDCWTDETRNLPDEQKEPLFPRFTKKNGQVGGFTREDLLQMQADDPANFACQYLNKPIAASQQTYSEEMLRGACVRKEDIPTLSTAIMVIDLATSDSKRSDDSVVMVGKTDAMGLGYICDMAGAQWTPFDLAQRVLILALKHRPTCIYLEKSAAGQVFAEFLRLVARTKNIFLPIEFIKMDTRPDAKTMRIQTLAGTIKAKRLRFFAGLPQFDKLIQQAIEFPRGRHDDYIDTAALLYGELNKEILSMPIKKVAGNPILALIKDRENALIRQLTADEEAQRSKETELRGGMTGLCDDGPCINEREDYSFVLD